MLIPSSLGVIYYRSVEKFIASYGIAFDNSHRARIVTHVGHPFTQYIYIDNKCVGKFDIAISGLNIKGVLEKYE